MMKPRGIRFYYDWETKDEVYLVRKNGSTFVEVWEYVKEYNELIKVHFNNPKRYKILDKAFEYIQEIVPVE